MNHDLCHLPAAKQRDLEHIVAVLRDQFEQVTAFSGGKKKQGKIQKIILFGSHATGRWVDKPATGYVSDYDILVIVNQQALVEDLKLWNTAEERIRLRVRPPLTLIVHTLAEVNDALARGQYFFTDIRREGIVLYESDPRELAKAGNLTPAEYKEIAERDFAHWFTSASEFVEVAEFTIQKGYLNKAAFLLHQATEHFYACLLLVLTNYKPYTHDLVQLNALAIRENETFAEIFPHDSKLHRRRFQLLKKAYIDARYSEHYHITEEELNWLVGRVKQLKNLTGTCCWEKIESYWAV
ncbi:HEPN domain-containing protein [Endothiovibrio diazotrophicus]